MSKFVMDSLNKCTDNGITWPNDVFGLPEPIREISNREFISLLTLGHYAMTGGMFGTAQLQEHKGGNEEALTVWQMRYYWFPDYGIATAKLYVPSYWRALDTELPDGDWFPRKEGVPITSGTVVRYFKVGCDHTYVEWTEEDYKKHNRQRFRGDHLFTCSKCGHRYGYSSG